MAVVISRAHGRLQLRLPNQVTLFHLVYNCAIESTKKVPTRLCASFTDPFMVSFKLKCENITFSRTNARVKKAAQDRE